LINNSTPIPDTKHRGSVRPLVHNDGNVIAMLGSDAPNPSESAHRFKKMIEKARPSTPLGGSY